MSNTYIPGELFVYVNGDRWELGQVKRPNNDGTGYFCWYSLGDTAANTPVEHMHKLANAGFSHIEGIMKVEDVSAEDVHFECSYCHCKVWNIDMSDGDCSEGMAFCPECGAFVDNMPPYAERGTVSKTYIGGVESGSVCPIPRTSVIFEGQKFTFDEEDGAKFMEIVESHLRKLAGMRGDAE